MGTKPMTKTQLVAALADEMGVGLVCDRITGCAARVIAVIAAISADTVNIFAGTIAPSNIQRSKADQTTRSSNNVFSFRCSLSAHPSGLRKRILSFSKVRLLPVG